MLIGRQPSYFTPFVGWDENNEAEICVPFDLEDVVIGNLAPKVEPLSCSSMISQFGSREISGKNDTAKFVFGGTNGADAARRKSNIGESIVKVGWNGERSGFKFGQNSDVTRWGLPVIHNDRPKFKFEMVPLALSETFASFYGNICPQLPFREFSSIRYLVQHDKYQQKISHQDSAIQTDNWIVRNFIDQARKRVLISYLIGILERAIGIALYLRD
jgi:hypothetical protein